MSSPNSAPLHKSLASFVALCLGALALVTALPGCPSFDLFSRTTARSANGALKRLPDFHRVDEPVPAPPAADELLARAMVGLGGNADVVPSDSPTEATENDSAGSVDATGRPNAADITEATGDTRALGSRMQIRPIRVPSVPRGASSQFSFGDGQRGWVTALPRGDLLTTPAYRDGKIFLGGGFASHRFFAFNAFNGAMDWSLSAPDGGPTAAIIEDDNVIFNTESCTIFVADADTGELRWKRWLGDPLMSQPAAAGGLVLSAYPADGAHVFGAFRLRDGDPQWQRPIPADVIQAPTVHGDTVYFATMDGSVFALALRSGRVRWRKQMGASSAVWVDGERLMLSRRVSRRGRAYEEPVVLDTGSGDVVHTGERVPAPYLGGQSRDRQLASGQNGAWGNVPHGDHLGLQNVASGWAFQGSSPAVSEGRAYVAIGGEIRAHEIATGHEVWRREYAGAEGAQALSPPAVVGSQIVFGTVDGQLIFADIDTGMTIRAWDVGQPVVFQPIVAQGWVYLATGEGNLIGLEIGDPQLDGWHMWGGNARHDGPSANAGEISAALLASLERPTRGTMRLAGHQASDAPGTDANGEPGDGVREGDEAPETDDSPNSPDLPLLSTRVEANVSGPVAEVVVTQSFENPHQEPIDALYLFPLPADAAVDDMEMHVGTRVIRGRIRRRARARRVFEQARSEGRRAALLEQQRPNLFAQRVANIQPGERIEVRIRYVQQLPFDRGAYELVYPMMSAPRFDPADATAASREANTLRVAASTTLSVQLDAGLPIHDISTPGHQTVVSREGSRAHVRLSDEAQTERDFVLSYAVGGDTPDATVLAHRPGDEAADGDAHGYFSLIVAPPATPDAAQVTARDITFVIDNSSSMRGAPMDHARGVVQRIVDQLGERDTFNLVRFSDRVEVASTRPLTAGAEDRALARTWLRETRPVGSTLMVPAIERALTLANREPSTSSQAAERLPVVVLLTDGYIANEPEVFRAVASHLGRARLYPVGLGSAVNRFVLERAAEMGRGDVVVGLLSESSEAIAERVATRVERPLFTDVTIDWGDLDVSDVYPSRTPDLFAGRPLVLRGRFERGGESQVRIRGTMAGERYERVIAVQLPTPTAAPAASTNTTGTPSARGAHRAQATLWARAAVHDRMNSIYLRDDPALIEEITQLGLRHHMVTQWTSFVAVDETPTPAQPEDDAEDDAEGEDDGARATVSPARSLPGDPEIRVPAPADALAVTVLLPFGETLAAAYESELGLWTTRFLVPRDAEEGTYPIDILVTLASGAQQHLRVHYTVDQSAPVLEIEVQGEVVPGGTVLVRASQILTEADLHQVGRTQATLQPGRAHLLHDTRRVEARLDSGDVIDMHVAGPGVWEAQVPIPPDARGALELSLTIVDMAANVRTQQQTLQVSR